MFDLVCGAGYVVRRVIFKAVHFQGNEDNSSQTSVYIRTKEDTH